MKCGSLGSEELYINRSHSNHLSQVFDQLREKIMAKLVSLLCCSLLMLQVCRTCNDHVIKEDLAITRQYSGDYFVNNYEMVPDDTWNALPYQPMRPRLPGDY